MDEAASVKEAKDGQGLFLLHNRTQIESASSPVFSLLDVAVVSIKDKDFPHGQRSLAGYIQSLGSQRVGHDLATNNNN